MAKQDKGRTSVERHDSYQTCAEIRESFRMDAARKGKQCPGGYWIAKDKKCGGGKGLGSPANPSRRKNRRRAAVATGSALGGVALAGMLGLAAAAQRKAGKKSTSVATTNKIVKPLDPKEPSSPPTINLDPGPGSPPAAPKATFTPGSTPPESPPRRPKPTTSDYSVWDKPSSSKEPFPMTAASGDFSVWGGSGGESQPAKQKKKKTPPAPRPDFPSKRAKRRNRHRPGGGGVA